MSNIPPDDPAEVHAPVSKEDPSIPTLPAVQFAPAKGEVDRKPGNPMLGAQGFEFDLNSAIRFAQGMVDQGMAPKGLKAGGVLALMEASKEIGIPMMWGIANLTLVNGRLGMMGDLAKALIRRSGLLKPGTDFEDEYFGEPFTESWGCTVTAHRVGFEKPFSYSFTIKEAITAGLTRIWTYPKDYKVDGVLSPLAGQTRFQSRTRDGWDLSSPWATYTKRQLMYRPLGFLCRDRFSDVIGCGVILEEFADYPASAISRKERAKELADRFTTACMHSDGPVEKMTPSEFPDEPPSIEEVCGGCQKSWSEIERERGEG